MPSHTSMPHATFPLVSVIIPTYNSQQFLEACLASVATQTYTNLEIIVVDNHSTDQTLAIAKKFTPHVYTQGPERSAQVNYGVAKATGEYVYKVDSDFILDPQVVQQCIAKMNEGFDAAVVHNTPDETISWIAKIRKFEVDMYKYDLTHSSARFVKKSVYQAIGGFNEAITAGEDYDFQNKLNRAHYRTGFIDAEALHKGEPTKLWPHLVKYYEYGKDFVNYKAENAKESKAQLSFTRSVYVRHRAKFLRRPLMAITFLVYNGMKYFFGGTGFVAGKLKI